MRRIVFGTTLVFLLSVYIQYERFKSSRSTYSTVIYDRDGKIVDAFLSPDEKWRFKADLERIGQRFVNANLCLEDQRFWDHLGVDPFSVLRASFQNLSSGKVVSGGSTITMQLARLRNPGPRSLKSKIHEAFDSLYLEMFLDKKEILRNYFELAPYGRHIEGIEAASHILLKKEISDADYAEIATLLLIPQLPSRIHTLSRAEWVRLRNQNLGRFRDCDLLSDDGLKKELEKPAVPIKFNWFKKPRHISIDLRKEGVAAINSTLDLGLQKEIERFTSKIRPQLNAKDISNIALMVVENKSGEVWSAVGNFEGNFPTAEINSLNQLRSPGSTLKPLIYALSIQEGLVLPESLVQDVPIEIGGYSPENYDRKYRGLISAEDSLSFSLNVPFVIMLRKLGMEYFLGHLNSLGIDVNIPREKLGLSAAIGALPVRPIDLAKMYLSFANGGLNIPLKLQTSEAKSSSDQWIDPGANELMGRALAKQKRRENIPSKFLLYGKEPIRWKTGTSQGRKDAWAVGYDSRFTVLVWLGNLDMKPSANLVGASVSGPVLFEIFDLLGKRVESGAHSKYYDQYLTETEVCSYSGLKPDSACKTKWITGISSRSLGHVCPYHQRVEIENETGLVVFPGCREGLQTTSVTELRLPEKVKIWTGRNLKSRAVHPNCKELVHPGRANLEIKYPKNGMTYFLLDGQKQSTLKLPLKFSGHQKLAELHCFLNGSELSPAKLSEGYLDLPAGIHRLSCLNEQAHLARANFKISQF